MPQNEQSFLLITGGTGLVGQYLIRDLLLQNTPLAVLVRPSKKEAAIQRIDAIVDRWESELNRSLPRPVVIEGDVSQDRLGISDQDMQWLKKNCNRILHNAAILQFVGENRSYEPWVTNFDGTRRLIDVGKEIQAEQLHYVSTAYVSGVRDGRILESELDCQQGFRNDYEASKFEAERWVHANWERKRLTVYRPGVIGGDSVSGFTSTYHGIYLYLRLAAMMVQEFQQNGNGPVRTPLVIPIQANKPRNIIAVDWVSRVITHLLLAPEAHGRNYHLTPDRGITPRQVIEYCYEYFNSYGCEFKDHSEINGNLDPRNKKLIENMEIYQAYAGSDPVFDNTNLKRFAGHIDCPLIDKAMIHRWLAFGEADQWGKRKKKVRV